MKPITKFYAVYNPYTRCLVVKYGNGITQHFFEEIEEWVCVNYNSDESSPYYLHIQMDYEESFQLLFYPRVEGSEDLNEKLGTYYNSAEKIKPRNIKIVHTEEQYNKALRDLGDY